MAKNNSYKFSLQAIIIAAIVSALVAGTAVYLWHQRELKTALAPYQKTEEERIIEAAKAYREARIGANEVEASYDARDMSNGFAQVSVGLKVNGNPTGGLVYILKRSAGHWLVIYTGHNLPGREAGQQFGLPEGWYQSE
jgi:hypothetical protein